MTRHKIKSKQNMAKKTETAPIPQMEANRRSSVISLDKMTTTELVRFLNTQWSQILQSQENIRNIILTIQSREKSTAIDPTKETTDDNPGDQSSISKV